MGFYSPQTLVADARRHGVRVLRPCLARSGVQAGLEGSGAPTGTASCLDREQPKPSKRFDPAAPFDPDDHRRDGGFAVRQGLAGVRGIGAAVAQRIVAEREAFGAYADPVDLAHRVGLTAAQLEALASAGCCEELGLTVREAIWAAGHAARDGPGLLEGTVIAVQPPLFPDRSAYDTVAADLWATGLSPDSHPVAHLRERLGERGILAVADLATAEAGAGSRCGDRDAPAAFGGDHFLNPGREGMANIICGSVWRHRRPLREGPRSSCANKERPGGRNSRRGRAVGDTRTCSAISSDGPGAGRGSGQSSCAPAASGAVILAALCSTTGTAQARRRRRLALAVGACASGRRGSWECRLIAMPGLAAGALAPAPGEHRFHRVPGALGVLAYSRRSSSHPAQRGRVGTVVALARRPSSRGAHG